MNQFKDQQKSHQEASTSREGQSLLVVDDEPTILDSLCRELTESGFEVTTAASGEEALTRIEDGFFDLVITDLSMPGLDGLQVLNAAKQRGLQTMVIILTGHGAMEHAINALRLGADDFLQKPCDTDELLFRISRCFAKQELLRKIAVYEKFLPVCSYCNKIRDDQYGEHGKGRWYSPEEYFKKAKGVVRVSHGCCPDCYADQMKCHKS